MRYRQKLGDKIGVVRSYELQRVLNASARLICTSKYDRGLSALLARHPSASAVQKAGISGIKHRSTSPTTAFQCPMLPVAGTCDPPAAIN